MPIHIMTSLQSHEQHLSIIRCHSSIPRSNKCTKRLTRSITRALDYVHLFTMNISFICTTLSVFRYLILCLPPSWSRFMPHEDELTTPTTLTLMYSRLILVTLAAIDPVCVGVHLAWRTQKVHAGAQLMMMGRRFLGIRHLRRMLGDKVKVVRIAWDTLSRMHWTMRLLKILLSY